MLFRLTILLAMALALTACRRDSYSRSLSGFSATDKKVLYDFRKQTAAAKVADAATARKALATAFPSFVSDVRECKPGRRFVSIRSTAEGSFTAAGVKQTVYLVQSGECGARPATITPRLLLFTAGAMTANMESPLGSAILGVYDLDADGKQEILLEDEGAGSGEMIKAARLVEFDKDKLATVEDFGQIYDDACATTGDVRSMRASLVYYLPPPQGQKPRFTVELYRAACPAKGQPPQWTRVSGK